MEWFGQRQRHIGEIYDCGAQDEATDFEELIKRKFRVVFCFRFLIFELC